jgi:hypothetical protein
MQGEQAGHHRSLHISESVTKVCGRCAAPQHRGLIGGISLTRVWTPSAARSLNLRCRCSFVAIAGSFSPMWFLRLYMHSLPPLITGMVHDEGRVIERTLEHLFTVCHLERPPRPVHPQYSLRAASEVMSYGKE